MVRSQGNRRVLIVDNYDSFTYNLVHYLQQMDIQIIVRRNDQLSLPQIEKINPSHIVVSPGPCDPDKAGLTLTILEQFRNKLPIFGVCLGHQAIGQAFGGRVVGAKQVMHGKTSSIYHNNSGVFKGLSQGFLATRYHSLVLSQVDLPDCLEISAWTLDQDGKMEAIMGIKHRFLPIEGVQFHPESVLSECGLEILRQFIAY